MRDVSLQPFANDRALVERTLNTLTAASGEIEKTLPLSAKALRGKKLELAATAYAIRPLQNSVPGSNAGTIQTTLDKTAKLVADARRALQISDIILNAAKLGTGTSLVAFETKKWENRNVDKQLPVLVQNPLKIRYAVVQDEHQPVSLSVFNITDHLLNVRLQIDNWRRSLGCLTGNGRIRHY